jgi:hypothetical protein
MPIIILKVVARCKGDHDNASKIVKDGERVCHVREISCALLTSPHCPGVFARYSSALSVTIMTPRADVSIYSDEHQTAFLCNR